METRASDAPLRKEELRAISFWGGEGRRRAMGTRLVDWIGMGCLQQEINEEAGGARTLHLIVPPAHTNTSSTYLPLPAPGVYLC